MLCIRCGTATWWAWTTWTGARIMCAARSLIISTTSWTSEWRDSAWTPANTCGQATSKQCRLGEYSIQFNKLLLGFLYTVKKRFAVFPTGMSLTKLPPGQELLHYSRPGRVWLVTSRLGTGKSLTFFYSVDVIWLFLSLCLLGSNSPCSAVFI